MLLTICASLFRDVCGSKMEVGLFALWPEIMLTETLGHLAPILGLMSFFVYLFFS